MPAHLSADDVERVLNQCYIMTISVDIVLKEHLMSNATIAIRVDSDLKQDATRIVEGLGMDLTTAVRTFLTQVVMQKALPFKIAYPNDVEVPSNETAGAIQWAADARAGKVEAQAYAQPDDLYADLGI
jgi:DNA-damage-inducible protein J